MEINAWVQKSTSNCIRYRAHQNPGFWPKKNSVSRKWVGKRQSYRGYFAIVIEAAVGIGIVFVLLLRANCKLSQPQMINLEVSQFVRNRGRDLCAHPSVRRPSRNCCPLCRSPIFIDDSTFD